MLVIFDTETTGLSPERDGIVQFASIMQREKEAALTTFERLCNPGIPIPLEVTALHGITNSDIQTAESTYTVLRRWWQHVQKESNGEQIILAGHNILEFDIPFVTRVISLGKVKIIDTYQLALRLEKDTINHKLETLHSSRKFPARKAHDALEDCWMVRDLLFEYMQQVRLGAEQLADWLAQPAILPAMPFGKHKGKPFRSIPKGYLVFMLSKNVNRDVQASIRRALHA